MSIKSDLSVLKVNIQNAKDKLYTNLVDKGVTDITTASTLDEMANSVSGITTGTTGETIYGDGIIQPPLLVTLDKQVSSVTASSFENLNLVSTRYMFWNCAYLSELDLSKLNTSNVTDMSQMFAACYRVPSLDLSTFDTSKVTNMQYMFQSCTALTSLDLSSFDTSNVTDMNHMFQSCSGLTSLNLSSFNTSNVTDMSNMFENCSGLTSLDLSSFDTSKVTTMIEMLCYCKNIKRIDGILDISSVNASGGDSPGLSRWTKLENLRKLTFKNLGYKYYDSYFTTDTITNWGVNSDEVPDARQSLIDSLITYSIDRVAVHKDRVQTVKLSTNTKAVLTEDEIAQITSKGYTIV